jgi:MoaA/NifB/PqqE/SkfB family radical SAM enzyme
MPSIYPKNRLRAWVDLSTFCNAGCPQCHRTDQNGLGKQDWLPLVQWSLKQFTAAYPAEHMHLYQDFEFCGTWGDPLMNKDIFKITEYILSADPTVLVQINTNGSIRNPDWWWQFGMMARERLLVIWDIDGVTQEMHSRYRQNTNLDKIKENMESYCTTPARADVMTIVFKHNEDYVDDIRNMVESLGMRGKVFAQESNRFYAGPTFNFMRANGYRELLEQTTHESDEFTNASVKDHRWRRKFDANGRKSGAL